MDKNQTYIQNLKMEAVPWHRLTTPYGRASDFPKHFHDMWYMQAMSTSKSALEKVIANIEHQNTLWHATPFAMIFLVRIFENAFTQTGNKEAANMMVNYLFDFFTVIAKCFHNYDTLEHAEHLPLFSDMLEEQYLWSEEYDEEEDELRYEEGEVFPDHLFYSFYYFSYQALLGCVPFLQKIENPVYKTKAHKLLELL